jgi:hypothetical protein
MTPYRALMPVALAFAISITPRLIAGPAYNDGDFTTYNWTAVKIQDTTAGQTAAFGAGGMATGGDEVGKAWRANSFAFSYNGSPTNQGILIGNLSTNVVYSPAVSGAINSISSFDIAATSSVAAGAPGLTLSVGLLLLQNGSYFTNQLINVGSIWNNPKVALSFSATDFTLAGSAGPLNPDFSTNGAAIEFGYVAAASVSTGASPAGILGTIGADDFVLTISNTPAMPMFTSQQAANGTNLSVTLSGLAFGESITWLVSTNLTNTGGWSTNYPNPTSTAGGTNGSFTITNWIYPSSPVWFLRALVE